MRKNVRQPYKIGNARSTIAAQVAAVEGAERAVVRRAEPRRAEHVGDLGGREPHQQRALEHRGHPPGQPAGADLERAEPSASPSIEPSRARVSSIARSSRASRAPGQADLGDPGVQDLGLAGQRPEDVEGVDVAGALPDRVERRLAVEERHLRLLDVAVAAEALERLGGHGGRALADPELGERERDPAERRLVARSSRRGRRRRPPAGARARSPPRTRRRGRPARSA